MEAQDMAEEAIRRLEEKIPEMAAAATRSAYEKAKQAGQTVVISKGGFIVEERADGTELILAIAKPRRKVVAGVSFQLVDRPSKDQPWLWPVKPIDETEGN
ncbi:hypothetical protein [Pseudomonas sp. 5Ae-yellow]|uniref:hypothetical protein n=1 Tax=Pseudomonas sp. 5Ae-yellow TaxID=2759848 RepID=UPI002174F4FF